MDKPPSLARYISQNSKKRVFPGGSSIDQQAAEVSPAISWGLKSESPKQEIIHHETIEVDMEGGHTDAMLIDGNTGSSDKGKQIWLDLSLGHGGSENSTPVDQVQSSKKHCSSESNSQINGDDCGADLFYGDDVHTDLYFDDLDHNDCAIVQSHFDQMDIPPGVEVPIPWMPGPAEAKLVSTSTSMSSTSKAPIFPFGSGAHSTSWNDSTSVSQPTPFEASKSLELAFCKNRCSATGNSKETNFKEQSSSRNLSPGAEESSNAQVSHHSSSFHFSNATGSGSWHSQIIPGASYFTAGAWVPPPPPLPPTPPPVPGWMNLVPLNMTTAQAPSGFLFTPGYMNSIPLVQVNPGFISKPHGVNYFSQEHLSSGSVLVPGAVHYFPQGTGHALWMQGPHMGATTGSPSIQVPDSVEEQPRDLDEVLKNFRHFKKFDTVQDHSDHYFSGHAALDNQASKGCAKRIQEEWKILEKDLPDTIFVRVYETRMDLLRAVIIGADGTPYHDGLFFFDVFFPSNYPNVPPFVHYRSFGLRINPNLYECGKVCLSLLNTWGGRAKEKWIPGQSTMLQVLVSIQGLILNEKPYFNEPGYARMSGTPMGEQSSQQYNEHTYINNLKTMVYCMRRPPQHFEDFVIGHYYQSWQDILAACKEYLNGARVGTLVRGSVQDVDARDKSCSETFKITLRGFIQTLVDTFTKIGVKDCDKFLNLAESQKATGVAPSSQGN